MNKKTKLKTIIGVVVTLVVVGVAAYFAYNFVVDKNKYIEWITNNFQNERESTNKKISDLEQEIEDLKNEDQRKINIDLKKKLEELTAVFRSSLSYYRRILEIEEVGGKTETLDSLFASILNELSRGDLTKVASESTKLATEITKEENRLKTLVATIPKNIPESNTAPGSGFSKQKVNLNGQFFVVDIVAADLSSTKVIVDTASDSTCTKDCPVLPLATYVSRSGAYAGINGTYFCPETYPDCADKKNTFDVLVMNKNKVYFNSDNNVYSTVPAAIFSGSSARFVRESSSWGRDTGVDAVIANRPLLILDGNVTVSTTDQNKENLRGNRGFLGSSDGKVYIGVVRGASVGEAALVLKEIGVKNAINLDSGGSTALWSGGYKAGPGRNIPNAVLFVKK